MAIDAVYFGQIQAGKFEEARSAALAFAQHNREHYSMIQTVDVATSVNGPMRLILVYRLNSLADWEAAVDQFQQDEKGQELIAPFSENSDDRQWNFYRIQEE